MSAAHQHTAGAVALTWRDGACAVALAAAVLFGAGHRMVPGVVGVIDDDAVYAVTAKALAEGDGYRLTNLPGAPAQTKYPVLYPALLALGWKAATTREAQIFAMQAMTAGMGAVAMALAYLYGVRFGVASRGAALAGAAITVTAPNVLFYCSQTLSEMSFAVALVAALWAVESRLRAAGSNAARDLLVGVLLGLPLLCRTAGVTIPVGVFVVLVWRKIDVRWIAAGAFAVTLPWFLWVLHGTAAAADGVIGYQTDYFGWWRANGSLQVPVRNLQNAAIGFGQIELEAMARALYARTGLAGALLFPLGILPWIATAARARRMEPLPVAMLTYFALLLAWPWPPDRFLVPILPFLAAFSIDGAWRLASRAIPTRAAAAMLAVITVAAMVSNGWLLSRYASLGRTTGFPYFNLTAEPVQWRHYREAFEWLAAHTKPGEVVAAGFDTMTSLYTDRPAVRPFELRPLSLYYGAAEPPLGTVAEFEDALARYEARYMLLTPLPAYTMETAFFELVYAASDRSPSMLRPVWQSAEDGRFVIFQVLPRAAGG